jgi:hypothetical protein
MRCAKFLTLLALALLGCKKPLDDVRDYFPRVTTESASVQPDGSVVVVGRVTHTGPSEMVAVGFCASTSPVPEMLESQALATLSGDRFTATYTGFATTGTYYFRAFAVNGSGYAYGNVISLSDIEPEPVVPTCTPNLNAIAPGGGLFAETLFPSTITSPQQGFSGWEVTGNSNAHNLTCLFGSALSTRIFTTTTSTSPGDGEARISFWSGFTSAVLYAGSPVYVNQLTPTQWEITICQAPWGASANQRLTTRFRVNA